MKQPEIQRRMDIVVLQAGLDLPKAKRLFNSKETLPIFHRRPMPIDAAFFRERNHKRVMLPGGCAVRNRTVVSQSVYGKNLARAKNENEKK